MSTRVATIDRTTAETDIHLSLNLDGNGTASVETGIGFFDHMLSLFARHSAIDLVIQAHGDLQVDAHHTVEDVGICLGEALRQALGDKRGIARYGHAVLPMDETLVTVAVDLSGRPYFASNLEFPSPKIGNFDSELVVDFWHAVSVHAMCNLHIVLHYGRNAHHIAEAVFKAVGRALRMAVAVDPRIGDVPSTKGSL